MEDKRPDKPKDTFFEMENKNNLREIKNRLKGKNYVECETCSAIKVESRDLAEALHCLSEKYFDVDETKYDLFESMKNCALEPEPDIESDEDFVKWYEKNERRECTFMGTDNYPEALYFRENEVVLGMDKNCECMKLFGVK